MRLLVLTLVALAPLVAGDVIVDPIQNCHGEANVTRINDTYIVVRPGEAEPVQRWEEDNGLRGLQREPCYEWTTGVSYTADARVPIAP